MKKHTKPAWAYSVYATFSSQRTDDLKHLAMQYVGKKLYWRGAWYIEDGPYAGQIAFTPDNEKHPDVLIGWVPQCDLQFDAEDMKCIMD